MPTPGPKRFEWKPSPDLRPCCVSYWGMLAEFPGSKTFPLTPDGFVEIVFTPDTMECKRGNRWQILSPVFVVGRLRETLMVRVGGRCRFVSIRLLGATAAMVLRPFGIEPNGVTSVTGSFGGLERTVLDILCSDEIETIRTNLDHNLSKQRGRWNPILPQVRTALSLTSRQPGKFETNGVGGRRLSRRQLERHIRQASGTNAKSLSGLARFHSARDLMWFHPGMSLADLAIETGYADQAHFTREFKKISGMTPLAFRRLLYETKARR